MHPHAHRSAPFWQDLRLTRPPDGAPGAWSVAPAHSRDSVSGLSVEYVKRYVDAAGGWRAVEGNGTLGAHVLAGNGLGWFSAPGARILWTALGAVPQHSFAAKLPHSRAPTLSPCHMRTGNFAWSMRGLLDFNLQFARFPSALPPTNGSFPPDPPGAAFTLLREGDAWLDTEHGVLTVVEGAVSCGSEPEVGACLEHGGSGDDASWGLGACWGLVAGKGGWLLREAGRLAWRRSMGCIGGRGREGACINQPEVGVG